MNCLSGNNEYPRVNAVFAARTSGSGRWRQDPVLYKIQFTTVSFVTVERDTYEEARDYAARQAATWNDDFSHGEFTTFEIYQRAAPGPKDACSK